MLLFENKSNNNEKVFSGQIVRMFRNCPKSDGWFGCFFEKKNGEIIQVTGIAPFSVEEGMELNIKVLPPASGRKDWQLQEMQLETNTEKSVISLLCSKKFPGIGLILAKKLYDEFGSQLFDVAKTDPHSLMAVKGMTNAKLDVLCNGISEFHTELELSMLFPAFSPKERNKIIGLYGDKAISSLRENPYRLLYDFNKEDDDISFHFPKVDKLALSIGFNVRSMHRIREAFIYTARQSLQASGDSFLNLSDNAFFADFLSATRENLVNASISEYELSKKITEITNWHPMVLTEETAPDGSSFYILYHQFDYDAEKRLGDFISKKMKEESLFCVSFSEVMEIIKLYERKNNYALDEEQKLAVYNALTNRISIITGGPGRGKTTVIKCLVYCFSKLSNGFCPKAILCAPTAKAATRMVGIAKENEMFCELPITIDRLLYSHKNAFAPTIVVIDEVSMVGFRKLSQFSFLLKNAQIVLVGDPDQLPSIEQGDVLKDLLDLCDMPITTLLKHYRAKNDANHIIENADKINAGDYNLQFDNQCFFGHYSDDSEAILASSLFRYSHYIFNENKDVKDIALLSPLKKGICGVRRLNYEIQNLINKGGKEINGAIYIVEKNVKTNFRVDDRVMQITNNKSKEFFDMKNRGRMGFSGTGVYNGDVGTIRSFDVNSVSGQSITVEMDDGRLVTYTPEEYDQLTLAYAMTIHKSQGSEYDVVFCILPPYLMQTQGNFASRNLIYTGITRAKSKLELIGSQKSLNKMIFTKIKKRKTFLREFILNNLNRKD